MGGSRMVWDQLNRTGCAEGVALNCLTSTDETAYLLVPHANSRSADKNTTANLLLCSGVLIDYLAVAIPQKLGASVYFYHADGSKKALGIILPGDYTFNSDAKELIAILSGDLDVLSPD